METNTLDLVYKCFFQNLVIFMTAILTGNMGATQRQIRSQWQHLWKSTWNETSEAEPESGKMLLSLHISDLISPQSHHTRWPFLGLRHDGTFSSIAAAPFTFVDSSV